MFDRSSSLSASNPNAQASNPNAQDGGPVFTRPFDRQHLTWGAVKEQNEEDIGKTKNHTGTLVGEDIYIFGGYDGLKNHNKLHVYNITSSEWSQPQPFGTLPTGRNGHSATLLYSRGVAAGAPSFATPGASSTGDFISKSAGAAFGTSAVPPVARGRGGFMSSSPGDHGGTGNHGHVVGTDLMSGPGARLAERNPDPGPTFAPPRSATAPFSSRPTRGGGPLLAPASNGLTPAAILILGGWLGNGPLAAGDVHLLDLPRFEWVQPEFKGNPPGPCNMHTADLVTEDLVLVFRGGDGRAYLNDLHALDLANRSWHSFPTTGELPPPRANHSSCVVGGTVGGGGAALAGTPGAGAINSSSASDSHLFVFGGWDGTKRLNDLYVLNVHSRVWSYVRTSGQPPMARAGMSLSNVSGLLYLFGGSGHTTKCFNDCHIFDPRISTWLEAAPTDSKLYYTKRKAQVHWSKNAIS